MRRRKSTDESRPEVPFLRALRVARSAADAAEAVAGILREAVAATSAEAGAVLQMPAGETRAVTGIPADALASLIERQARVREVLARPEEWVSGSVTVSIGDSEPEMDARWLLMLPAGVRGSTTGALMLLLAEPPEVAVEERAAACASLLGLVLENERLYEEAREALQAREHFLVALNHELRTPATSLMLDSEMIRMGEFGTIPPRLERALRDTELHMEEMVAVLRRVLDLGKLGEQANPELVEVIQPRQTVLELLRRIEPAAKRKNLTLALFVPPTLPALQTDVARFSRIILHILSNAVKYTAAGGIEVRLERSSRRAGGQRQEPVLVVRVKDSGRGIPEEELERIFEPFTQVEEGARTDSRSRGLGLGLPLARQMARTLGGEVTIESEPGRGTTVTLVLPFQPPATAV